MADKLRLDNLPDDRYKLGSKIGSGVWGILYEADDNKTENRVTIKIVNLTNDRIEDVHEEYKVYNSLSPHSNIANFCGIYRKQGRADTQQAWVITELCEGGCVGDVIRKQQRQNKRLPETHIAYILRELTKAIVHLHENNVIHRAIRADNVMLTADGHVKLTNFGLCKQVESPEEKLQSCIGAPCWMAPEIATCGLQEHEGYDMKADVWALGITAIELGDGKPPLQNIHPARALFQITRNPPPTMFRPANWSQLFNDFVTECLEKNPENRPYAQELLEHPFFETIADNDHKIRKEVANVIADIQRLPRVDPAFGDVLVRGQYMEQEQQSPQKLLQEDLAALEDLSEDALIEELQQRAKRGQFYTFVGDVLLAINPHQNLDIYGLKDHVKYQFKARSDNAPHIYTIADKAYQDVLHNEEPQHVLFAGETMSGKTTNMDHVIKHLLYLGKGNACAEYIEKGVHILRAFGNAATPHNPDSTRHLLQTQMTFTSTGKVSGAIFWLYLLEKTRISLQDKKHANFHVFYYFYDALECEGTLPQWNLESGRDYRYLRIRGSCNKPGPRENQSENPNQWRKLERELQDLDIDIDHLNMIKNILAAILLLGEIEFEADDENNAKIATPKIAESVARLLGVDQKKFSWALLNYCIIVKGDATRQHHSVNDASEARDVLAQGLYSRLVDWIVCKINEKMSVGRALFGDRHCINILDLFGFECFSQNTLQQLFINCVNEQLQFHYNQRVFVWEMQDGEEEEIPVPALPFYDNKIAVDQLLGKPDGLMYTLDDASRGGGLSAIIDKLQEKRASHVSATTGAEFTVAHYTGRVAYEADDFPDKNRDFLPPEMIETLRRSNELIVPILFTGMFSKSGNLTVEANPEIMKKGNKGRWGAALTAEHEKSRARKYNTQSKGQYSQTRQMRTASATFRGTCLELLRSFAGSCGVHFVRCVRGNLTDQPGIVQTDLLKQQLKALAILDTARARQNGFSVRIPFNEFIRRYQFLAFDFDEQVDVTKDNCRLLLVRLKMEGWIIGKTKVFLKYYNEEFLNRLYETQVKKIVKVQSMMRAFLAKRNMATKIQNFRKSGARPTQQQKEKPKQTKSKPVQRKSNSDMDENEAAIVIQRQIRGSLARKQYGPMIKASSEKLDQETISFMRSWCKRWKLKSIYQVLLLYRATRHQDLVYFSQQAHLYNQNALCEMKEHEDIDLKSVDPKARGSYLPPLRPSVHKLPFRLGDLPYFDSTYICDPSHNYQHSQPTDERWDAPLQRNIGEKYKRVCTFREQACQTGPDNRSSTSLPETPYVRDQNRVKLQAIDEKRGNPPVYKGVKKPVPREMAPPPPQREIVKATRPTYGPIKEMQEKFKSDNDEAPFNFQGMLRKTNNKRESLRRSDGFNNNHNSARTFNNNNNVVYQSKKRDMELAPGVVIHGEVADL